MLPTPPGWERRNGPGLVVAAALTFGVPMYLRMPAGGSRAAFVALAAAGTALIVAGRRRGGWRHVRERSGLFVPCATGPMVVATAGGVLAAAGCGVFIGARTSPWVGVLLAGGLGLVGAGALLHARPWSSGLRLTPTLVSHVRAGRRRAVAWDEVTAVDAKTKSSEARGVTLHNRHLWVRRGDRTVLDVAVAELAAPAEVTYWLVRYYWEHPEARAELADGRVVDRVERAELVPNAGLAAPPVRPSTDPSS